MIARKSALITILNIGNGILGYAALFFIARYMNPGEYGVIGFATGFVGLFLVLGTLGFDSAHVKRVSEGKDLGECISTFIVIKIILASLFAIGTLSALFFWKYALGRGFESPADEIAIYIILGCFVLETITQSLLGTYNARQEIAKSQLPVFFQTAVRVALTIFVAISGLGVIALVFTYLAGEIVLLCSALLFFRGYPFGKPSKELFKSYTIFSFPLIIASAANIIAMNLDRVLIQLFWNATEGGYYFAARGLTNFIDTFTIGVGTLLFPSYSVYYAKKDMDGIRTLTLKSERYMSMISFPLVVGMAVLAGPAVRILLSSDYVPAITILEILPLVALLNALNRPYGYLVMGINRPEISRNMVVLQLCVNAFFNIILIPEDIQSLHLHLFGLGAYGAAISLIISSAVGLVYSRFVVWRLTKATGSGRIFYHLIAAGVMAVVLYLINTIILIARWYQLLAVAILGLGVYLCVLWILREFTKKDLIFFLDTLSIKKMFTYIHGEIRDKK